MAKKKVVKKVVKKVKAPKAAKPKKELKAKSLLPDGFQTQVAGVLNHILALLKAALVDAFRQYIESQVKCGKTPSVEQFLEANKSVVALHGIDGSTLIASLSEAELDLIAGAQAQEIIKEAAPVSKAKSAAIIKHTPEVKEPPAKAQEPEVDPLDPIANKGTSQKAETSDKKSVFDGLDLI